ncbi:putative S-adenosylmethionine-dependent [Cardiosporidium cionae]|uniref:S-adenosylmethionine-dependent n=1 Tax=Cardiosporidium cionae TaxID=476202 RepID=A0ABQ7J5D1_9APIC|nr:putative S-adenosylmethionine-dependent [Cardiosporidium cionae]|eukprot:KAF8819221.1 putative S-adenosylmethionine-dependent [Cardiosporidium cionae]
MPHKLPPLVRFIGEIRSCYTEKWGTPRQSGLVPASSAEILFHDDYSKTFLSSVEGFSYVIVIFAFHHLENSSSGQVFLGNKCKVRPPKLQGKSIGILATRSPHRPNPLGLSVCKVVKIDYQKESIVLSGIDMIDGTPVLDLYGYDFVSFAVPQKSLSVPQWTIDSLPFTLSSVASLYIQEENALGIHSLDKRDPHFHAPACKVYFSLAAFWDIQCWCHHTEATIAESKRRFAMIQQTLQLDPRSIHSAKNHTNGIFAIEIQGQEVIYQHCPPQTFSYTAQKTVMLTPSIRVLRLLISGRHSTFEEWKNDSHAPTAVILQKNRLERQPDVVGSDADGTRQRRLPFPSPSLAKILSTPFNDEHCQRDTSYCGHASVKLRSTGWLHSLSHVLPAYILRGEDG